MPDAVLPVGCVIVWCIAEDGATGNEVFYVQDWDVMPLPEGEE